MGGVFTTSPAVGWDRSTGSGSRLNSTWKTRGTAQVARRTQLLQQQAERHILMPERPQTRLPHPLQQFREPRVARQVGPQRHRVHEHADHVLKLGLVPVRHRRAHNEVVRPRVPV